MSDRHLRIALRGARLVEQHNEREHFLVRIAEEAVVVFTHIADGDVEQVGVVPGNDFGGLFEKRGDVPRGNKVFVEDIGAVRVLFLVDGCPFVEELVSGEILARKLFAQRRFRLPAKLFAEVAADLAAIDFPPQGAELWRTKAEFRLLCRVPAENGQKGLAKKRLFPRHHAQPPVAMPISDALSSSSRRSAWYIDRSASISISAR